MSHVQPTQYHARSRRHPWPGIRVIHRVVPALCLVAAALTLQGCNQQQPAASGPRVFAADLQGSAKQCTTPRVATTAGQMADATMQIGNDGGWCGLTIQQNGKPYDAGLLSFRPAHGEVLIHTVGDATRIDYTPDRGYTGTDSFTVSLLPGDAKLRVAVTISPPTAKS